VKQFLLRSVIAAFICLALLLQLVCLPTAANAAWHTKPLPSDDDNTTTTILLVSGGVLVAAVIIYLVVRGGDDKDDDDDKDSESSSLRLISNDAFASNSSLPFIPAREYDESPKVNMFIDIHSNNSNEPGRSMYAGLAVSF
jgi:hypothetical protein